MKTKLLFLCPLIFLIALAWGNLVRADYEPTAWRYFKEIKFEKSPQANQLVKVTLDQDVFAHTNNNLSDLRIISNTGQEVPYKLIIEKATFSEKNIYPIKILNNSVDPNRDNLFIVDFGQSGLLNSQLKVLTSSENFQRQAEIAGGDDLENWHILKTDAYIFDYTNSQAHFNAQETSIDYPENAYRYIQVKIFTSGEAPLKINGAQVSKITKNEAKEMTITPGYQISQVNRTTQIILDLEKRGWPTGAIILAIAEENFNREVIIYESNDQTNWHLLTQGYIFNYQTPKFKGANLTVSYPESSTRYLKVEIYNGDNQPLTINGFSLKTTLRNVAFQYAPDTNYLLYYGNKNTSSPEYDLEKFFGYLDADNTASALLTIEQENHLFKIPKQPKSPLTERLPYLLPLILIATVLILGILVFRFLKKIKNA